MHSVGAVLKLLLDNTFHFFRKGRTKETVLSLVKNVVVMLLVFGVFYFLASKIISFLAIQTSGEIFAIALLLTQVIALVFATSNIINKMFMNNDNNLLLSMPISFNNLFIAKVLTVYVSELIFNIIYIFPIFAALGVIFGLGFGYFIGIIILLPFISILPIAVGALFSVPIMFVVKYFKSHPIFTIFVALISIIGIFVVYMLLVSNVSGAFNLADKQIENAVEINFKIYDIGGSLFYCTYIMRALINFAKTVSIANFFKYFGILLAYFVGSIIVLLPCLILIKNFFLKIITMNEQVAVIKTKKTKEKHFKRRSQFGQLLYNEFMSVIRSPNELFKYFLITILMPIIVFTYDYILKDIEVNLTGNILKYASHYFVVSITCCLSSMVSSIAISRQGGLFYMIKSQPIDYKKQISAKVLFNSLVTITMLIITMIVGIITDIVPIQVTILSTITGIFITIGHVCHSIDFDLRSPSLNWYDVSDISTISKSTALSVVLGLVISSVLFVVTYVFFDENLMFPLYLDLALAFIYCIFRVYFLALRSRKAIERMEL